MTIQLKNWERMGKMKKIIPELRFPEFVIDGEWAIAPLSEVYSLKITNSFSRDKLNYKKGTVKNIHYGDIHTKFPTLFDITKETVPYINSDIPIDRIDQDNYCVEGDMIFADASEDMDDVGKSIEIVNLNNEQLLAGLHTFLARQIEQNFIVGFGGYLFKSKSIRTQIKRESQGAKVLGISKGRISDINIYFPENKEEQKKITSCLSSLDELLVMHNDKLQYLKNHKKGLMQNLFPQEGKKVPNYRFPEFEDDGKWEEVNLEKYIDVIDGDRGQNYPKSGEFFTEGYCVFLNAKNVTKEGFAFNEIKCISKEKDELLRNGKLKKYDIVLTTRGSLGHFAYYNSSIPFNHLRINSGMVILRILEKVNPKYFYMYCGSGVIRRTIENMAYGNAVQQLTVSGIKRFPLLVPPSDLEQQIIASCLSALDELIINQAEKTEQLQQHKKGLMQGLFPKIKS